MAENSFVLTAYCANRPGIVAAVSKVIFEAGGNIADLQQFDDPDSGQFFSRVVFGAADASLTEDHVRGLLSPIMERFAMTWSLRAQNARRRVLLMASRFDHCLADLLYRWRMGELNMDVAGIVSNYPRETYPNLSFGDIPFHHLPVTKATKAAQ